MTPFELQVLLHYYGCGNDFRNGDFSAPALKDLFIKFCGPFALLDRLFGDDIGPATYKITDKGRFYVEALTALPLPVPNWEIPTEGRNKLTGGKQDV